MTTRTTFIDKIKVQLDELNISLKEMEDKAEETREDMRAKYREELVKARHQSHRAVTKLEEIRSSTQESWEGMVDEMENVRDAFKHSLSYFKSQIK